MVSYAQGVAEVTTREGTMRKLAIEELEARIAPSVSPGLQGFEGQPGNQGGNPSGSANPEVPAGARPQPNP
jgi:hypothetical protein